jgi:VanZ family protein
MNIKKFVTKHSFFVYQVPIFLLMIIILFYSVIPKPHESGINANLNLNLLHVLAYFTLSFLIGVALRHSKSIFNKKYTYFAILFSWLFGALNEVLQLLVPLRHFSLSDLLGYNLGGIVVAQIVLVLLIRKKNFKWLL